MCLEDFFSQRVERHNKPEVEVQESKELLLNPIIVSRNGIFSLKHESSIFRSFIQPCMWFMDEPSPVGQTVQSLTCSIMEKPHTGLDE